MRGNGNLAQRGVRFHKRHGDQYATAAITKSFEVSRIGAVSGMDAKLRDPSGVLSPTMQPRTTTHFRRGAYVMSTTRPNNRV